MYQSAHSTKPSQAAHFVACIICIAEALREVVARGIDWAIPKEEMPEEPEAFEPNPLAL
ncbi:MAG: hypothetical protein PHW75_00980 [Patescibacteria group bacterium]|nr:hypothetical protein [Patescibacteria group bacterium]